MILDANTQDVDLKLDSGSLDPASLSMGALMREIDLRKRPPALLRFMMNALENKRQRKRLGWSRPWNKQGMTVFRTHNHHPEMDQEFLMLAESVFWDTCGKMPETYRDFAKSLWADPRRMAFTFYHNNMDETGEYEGLTLSLGRKVPEDKTKRDRIDFILEDFRSGGSVDSRLDRARILVNPFAEWERNQVWTEERAGTRIGDRLHHLYAECLAFYGRHRDNPERQWNHWAFRYIDYFGARAFIPRGSAFT